MGLPLFITPSEPQAIAKSPEKMVAVPRSAIRRRPIARPRHSSNSLRRRLLGSLEHSREEAYQIWEGQSRHSIAEAEHTTADSLRARAQRFLDQERSRTQELPTIDREASGIREFSSSAMPAVPEADAFSRSQESLRDLQRARQITRDQIRRMARRHAAPTPPYLDQEVDSLDYPFPPPPRMSSMTPSWSPVPTSGNTSPRRTGPENDDTQSFLSRMQDIHRRPSLAERVQALNRASDDLRRTHTQFRQARILRQATLDGLGDRNRSLSPDNGAGAWDTLLTSITPDPQPPSVGSSFASTSATAATASMSNSAPSSAGTSMTSSGGTQGPAVLECDISEDSNTDEDDEEDIYELHEFNSRRGREHRDWRTYASALVVEPSNTRQSVAEPEHLDGMHRIISRLAERDEIPDEWWASAGLSRNLRREPSA